MRERRFSPASAAVGALAASTVVLVVLFAAGLGSAGGGRGAPAAAVELADGVPVGVGHTRPGALAAADNYVALASQSIEQDPAVFAELVAQAYAPGVRARTLAQAQELRGSDLLDVGNYRQGGRGIAVIAARRLDSYTPAGARVTSWLGGFVWGPDLAPRQSWNLVDTTLRWQSGRWLIVSCNVDATPAPVPSIVSVNAGNDQASAFERLAGMTAPFYGTGG